MLAIVARSGLQTPPEPSQFNNGPLRLVLLAAAVLLLRSGWSIKPAFAVLTGVGAAFGIADILMFQKINEPPVRPLPQPTLLRVFSAPFIDRQFRSYIGYACFWHFAAMVGAPFISLYLLDHIGMSLGSVLLLWAGSDDDDSPATISGGETA